MTHNVEQLLAELAHWRQRAQACAAALQEGAIFHALFELTGVGTGQISVASGAIERCNRKLQAILGYDKSELQGRVFVEFAPPEDRETLWEAFHRLVSGETPEVQMESRFVRKDGSIGWSLLDATVFHDPTDASPHVVGTLQDITDRVGADAALRRSEAMLRLLTENIEDVFWMTTPDQSKVLYVSSGYERLWGRSRDQLYQDARTFYDAIHPDDRPLLERAAGARDAAVQLEYRIIDARGEVHWIHDRSFPVRNGDGHVEYVAGIATDITDHKRADLRAAETARRLAVANQGLERFALAVSHDLKAPLRAVSGLASTLEEDFAADCPPQAIARLRTIVARIGQMNGLIDDLLQYARAGHYMGAKERVEVRSLAAAQVAAMTIPPEFRVYIADDLPVLETYAAPLGQVFANLIGNAVRHHTRVDGRCWVNARDMGNHIEFTVSDDGPGIPPEQRERVFDMFYSLKPKQPESTGVGLALVRRVVESAGGRIRLDQSLAGGSAFTFTWPKQFPEE